MDYSKKLLYIIRTSSLGRNRLYHHLRYISKKKQRDIYIKTFIQKSISQDERDRIYHGMKEAWIKYHWNFEEYFLFKYDSISEEERKAFICEYEKNIFSDIVNNPEQAAVLHSKTDTYNVFGRYFKRDVVCVSGGQNLREDDAFMNFIEAHHNFIMKPTTSSCGKGIVMIRANSKAEAFEFVISSIEKNTDYLVEELIEQVDEMAEFHPQSVNTVRIPTYKVNNEIHILQPFMRTGRGDSFVDNAGSGGVFAVIDPATGKTIAACDEKGKDFTHHPDSGKQMIGFTIPQWDEAVAMAKELAMILPDVKYTGWDLALTPKGWVMVEGNNRAQMVGQYALHKGCRTEFEKLYKQMI